MVVLVNGMDVGSADIASGSGSFTIRADKLIVGENTVNVTFAGNENFTAGEDNVAFVVTKKVVPVDPELAIAPVAGVEEGNDVTISISALSNFTGFVTVSVNGDEGSSTLITEGSGTFTIPADKLIVGKNTVKVISAANENFTAGEANVTFNVTAKPIVPVDPELVIAPVGDVEVGEPVTITISALSNFTGSVKVLVNGAFVDYADIASGSGTFIIAADKLVVGENIVKVVSVVNENFTEGEANVTFNVNESVPPTPVPGAVDPELNITSIPDAKVGENVTITIGALSNFTGSVKVLVNDIFAGNAEINAGKGNFTIAADKLVVGENIVKVISAANDNFTAGQVNATFNVNESSVAPTDVPNAIDQVPDAEAGNDVSITISGFANITGSVKVLVNGVYAGSADISDGKGTFTIPADKLAVGENTVKIISAADGGTAYESSVSIKVSEKTVPPAPALVDPALTVSVTNVTEGEVAVITVTTNATFSGNVTVKIENTNYTVAVVNGTGSLPVSGLAVGNYTAVATFAATEVFSESVKNTTFTVKAKIATKISAPAITTTFGTSKDLVVTLTDANGNALANKKVTVVLNGVKKELTTDAKGQVKFAIGTNLAAKVYTATFTFDGDAGYAKISGSAKVTVNKAKTKIVAKKKTFKKSKKAKKYTITLKAGNKAVKKVKVTITGKFKGKKIKITKKTNNKGKATFNLKKLTQKGKFKATIKFNGSKNYEKATKKVKITIK